MAWFGAIFTAIRRGFVQFIIGCNKCKPPIIFGLFLILTIIFSKVTPTSPLSFFFAIASYISGAVLFFWIFTTLFGILFRTKD